MYLTGSIASIVPPIVINTFFPLSEFEVNRSDACFAMELGCDAVLVNSAIAQAKDPIGMAESFKNAVIAGRQCFLSGKMTSPPVHPCYINYAYGTYS